MISLKAKFKKLGDNESIVNVQKYKKALDEYIDTFDEWLKEKDDSDKKLGLTLKDDVKTYLEKYKGDYEDFLKNETKKSLKGPLPIPRPVRTLSIIFS